MNNFEVTDFVDLTNSFTLADHCALANVVIDLDTDDSIIEDNVTLENSQLHIETANSTHSYEDRINDADLSTNRLSHPKHKKILEKKNISLRQSTKSEEYKYGCCPICWEELGKNPLVSTKCGHVYCLKCLKRSLSIEKRCPTCRNCLKGKNTYHPLYLPL